MNANVVMIMRKVMEVIRVLRIKTLFDPASPLG